MSFVVVKAGSLKCSHTTGTIAFTSGNPLLTVNGVEVIVSPLENGLSVAGCPFTSGGNPSPCTTITSATSGVSLLLTVSGQGVLLDAATGNAINPNDPSASWDVVSAGQSILSSS